MVDLDDRARRGRVHARARRRAASVAGATSRARPAQRPQRRRRRGDGARARRRARGGRAALGRFARRGPPLRAPGRGRRRHVRRRLRPPARPRSRRRSRPRARATGGRVVCVFQPHRYSRTAALWHGLRRRFDDADVLVVTDIYPAGEAPRPGITGKLVVDAVLDAHPHAAGRLPAAPRRPRRATSQPSSGRATCASRSAPATSPRCPTSCSSCSPARAALMAARRSRRPPPIARRRSATARRRRSARSPPTGSAGRGRCFASSCDDEHASRRVVAPAVAESRASPSLVVGKGSNLLVADAGLRRPGRRARRARSPTVEHRRHRRCGPGRRRRLPVVARRTAAAGLTGFEWAVGVPGSIGGAVRMNAGGHGSDMAAVARQGPRRRPGSGEDGRGAAAELDLGYRTLVGRHRRQVVVVGRAARCAAATGPAPRPRSPRSCAGGASNQPGGPNAGSVFTNPPGDSAGRLIDAAGCKGLRRRHGRGVDQARQLHPGRRRRVGRRRAGR